MMLRDRRSIDTASRQERVRSRFLKRSSANSVLRGIARSFSFTSTSTGSSISAAADMTKAKAKIGRRNPFIPSHSPICNAADTAMIAAMAGAGVLAVLAVVIKQIASGPQ
ncbi:hypothetical protein [Ensifer soli]|uniref:hypothetical protein n=1 Tax=Ciceribacter sp. sgz301302 TaxID=3342379 RepID=UPI0035BA7595